MLFIQKIFKTIPMKKVVFISILLFSFTACHSQEKHSKNNAAISSTKKSPQGNWTVHKKYDKNGNLIAKDSTYTYRYSSINHQGATAEQAKQIRQKIKDLYENFGLTGDFPGDFTTIDSIQGFLNGINFNAIQQQMRQQMDSLSQQFFNHNPHQKIAPRQKEDSSPSQNQTDFLTHQI